MSGFEKQHANTGRPSFHDLTYEHYRGKRTCSAGVLVSGIIGLHTNAQKAALVATQLAETVNVYTDGNEEYTVDQIRFLLKDIESCRVINEKITGFKKDPEVSGEAGVLVALDDGTVNKESFIVCPLFNPSPRQSIEGMSKKRRSNLNL